MKSTKASQFGSDWEYEQAKKEERKRTKLTRQHRRTKHQSWQDIA